MSALASAFLGPGLTDAVVEIDLTLPLLLSV